MLLTGTVARLSSSVRFTAFDALIIINNPKGIKIIPYQELDLKKENKEYVKIDDLNILSI